MSPASPPVQYTGRIRDITHITPTLVAAYVQYRGRTHAEPTVKELAAVRMLFDWLVVGKVLPASPAHSVRGPKRVVKRGKTPILTRGETRELLDSIETDTVGGLHDHALIGVLVYPFARIALKVDDYFPEGERFAI